jgi:glycosyltransferase involved in cell wall biosynthesis
MNTPLLLLAFNRPKHTKAVFERIREIRPKALYIALDGPRKDLPEDITNCNEVKKIILEGINWKCSIHTLIRDENLGCGLAVSSAIDWFFSQVEQGIILEDDILPDPSFFLFCEELLEYYKHDTRVMMISGFNILGDIGENEASYSFYRFGSCWGWATWRRAWKFYDYKLSNWNEFHKKGILYKIFQNNNQAAYIEFNLNQLSKHNNSYTWDYQWEFARITQCGLSIAPRVNLIKNIGFDSEATHTKTFPLNTPVESIDFPIIHPKFVFLDEHYEKQIFENITNIGYTNSIYFNTPNTIGYIMPNKKAWPWINKTDVTKYGDKIDWPRISIVTPTLNQGNFIEETIRSVIFQGYPNLQYIIIDGGSTDNTINIIRKYEKYIDYWVSEKDQGQSDAINKGLSKSNGTIFNWINSDDYYEQNAFKIVAEAFMEAETDLVVAREYRFFNKIKKNIAYGSTLTVDLEQTVLTGHIDQPSTFWKREKLISLGNLDVEMHYAMDADMWIRYLLAHGLSKIKKINNPIVNFRYHSASKTIKNLNLMINEKHSLAHSLARTMNLPEEYLRLSESLAGKLLTKEYFTNVAIDKNKFKMMYKDYLLQWYISKKDFSKAIIVDTLK